MYYDYCMDVGHCLNGALAFVIGAAWDGIVLAMPAFSLDTDSSLLIHVSHMSRFGLVLGDIMIF